jgi:hypothetical protein
MTRARCWYWLMDGLIEPGYQVQRVNTSAVCQYEGLKYVDDRHDARWLARLLHLAFSLRAPRRCVRAHRRPHSV